MIAHYIIYTPAISDLSFFDKNIYLRISYGRSKFGQRDHFEIHTYQFNNNKNKTSKEIIYLSQSFVISDTTEIWPNTSEAQKYLSICHKNTFTYILNLVMIEMLFLHRLGGYCIKPYVIKYKNKLYILCKSRNREI